MTISELPSPRLATPIAIVGLSAIFAKAANLPEYWDNIVKKIDAITDVPLSRWNLDDYYDADPTQPDKTYCRRGGFIPDIAFDPLEFGLPPNILELTDVSQLLALVVAKQALEDAGYGAASEMVRQRTGVILGIGGGQKLITPLTSRLQYPVWEKVLRSLGLNEEMVQAATERMKLAYIPWEENSFPGMLGNVISGRVANRLDLGGVNCVVDAACASSLSALQMAVGELTSGRSDMMLTGGVDTDNSIFMYMSFSKTPAFSRKNEIKPFDAESDGMMIGEGLGMLVLKRLSDAERDGDRIYAVIKGLGASSDGRYKSIYAPSSAGQALALHRAYDSAGFAPSTVGLIEAHGTGTVAGDLCEVTTLNQVFKENNSQRQHIALGSVKSQIGHTKAAAGTASMIKVALALHHKILPPTINVQQPHPQLDMENSPFYLNTETRPWIRGEHPRRAGVSAFGFGGTNFHIVLEEYEPEQRAPYRRHRQAQTIVLHAPTPESLRARALDLNLQLQSPEAEQAYVRAQADSANLIPAADARLAFVAETLAEARELLALAADQLQTKAGEAVWQHPKGIFYRRQALGGKVVALFSGQGAQHVEMGRELLLNFPVLRETFHKVDQLFRAEGRTPVSQVVYPAPAPGSDVQAAQTAALQRTDYAQPAIGALSAGLYQLFTDAGFRADFVAGHSFGELTALWAAGVLDEPTYFHLVKARGASMAPPAHPGFDAGTMLAVTGSYAQLQSEIQHLPGVYLANWNAHNQVVLAGPTSAIEAAQSALQARGYSVTRLPVAAAFHTPLVGHAQQPFAQAIHAATFGSPSLPVYANATAQPYPVDPRAIQEQLAQHLLQPVLFTQQIENLYAAGGTLFIEFGPRNILTNLVKNILADRPHVAVALNVGNKKDSDRQLREAVAQLRVVGLPLRELDPFAVTPKLPEIKAKRALNVKLNGSNYVSDKTRAAYENALGQPGPEADLPVLPLASKPIEIRLPDPEPVIPAAPVVSAQVVVRIPEPVLPAVPAVSAPVVASVPAPQPVLPAAAPAFPNEILAQFFQQQAEVARLHEQFLRQHVGHTEALLKLMSGEVAVPAVSPVPPAAAPVEPISAGLAPAPVVPIVVPTSVGVLPVAVPVSVPSVPESVVGPDLSAITQTMLEIVSEKTGYPMETLEPGMDMESDLGIDSIKRVEILGAMQARYPDLPKLKPEELAELRTLAQIIEHMGAAVAPVAPISTGLAPAAVVSAPVAPTSVSLAPVAVPSAITASVLSAAQSVPASVVLDLSAITQTMLEIVSEKTGYPVETLEPGMDMESDLGIDSIKRVEILGAMQTRYPDLPKLKPEELAELRTLAQIIEHMGAAVAPTSADLAPAPVAPVVVPAVAPTSVGVLPANVPAQAGTTVDLSAITQTMLEIVSEKTGYPVETLEPGMDMESDLGIDSIKRVEILGAMQTRYPDLPKLKPEELAELRTLAQIIEHMGAAVVPASADLAPAPVAPVVVPAVAPTSVGVLPANVPAQAGTTVDLSAITQTMLEIVSEKTGYPVETLEPGMDMESDLGIDSIKRVEILGAMQTRYPDLPKLKPEELAELRTLAQIIEHMGAAVAPVSQTAAASVLSAAPSVEKSAPSVEASVLSVPASAGPDLSAITQTMLEIVSEKTGYPVETLEPGMDMESDLGIDSIKRVEILGAMQTRYPDLPKLKPEELAELRTLAQIIEHMGAAVAPTSADLAPAPVVPVVVPTSVSVLPASVAVPVSVPSVPESVLAPDLSAITQTMLEIVSEKTGYPVETLEPGMDMESDLGIDSIKRVEILGAMQTRYPELPKLKPEELAELRTLAQIIEHMGAAVAPASAGLAPTEVVVTPVDVPSALPASVLSVTRSVPASVAPVIPDAPRVLRSAVRLKALPFPDVLEANLPAGFIALLTNDGTPATTKLANALTERGWPVVVMNFPQAVVNALNTLPVHIPQVTLPELGEATLAQMLKTVEAQYGRIGAFIHLNPESSAASASPFVESEKAIVKEVFLMAKHLKESLAAAASAGRSYFVTVARLDGEFGLGATGSFGAISGGLFGLTKTLSREWQAVYCRALDLVPHLDTDRAVQYILAELQDPNRLLTEVAYGLRGRTTLVGENE